MEDTMRIATLVKSFFLLGAGLFLLSAGLANAAEPCLKWEDGVSSVIEKCSEMTVTGMSRGNHVLDCTVIRPWTSSPNPKAVPYPVIAWANGWDQGNVVGEFTTLNRTGIPGDSNL